MNVGMERKGVTREKVGEEWIEMETRKRKEKQDKTTGGKYMHVRKRGRLSFLEIKAQTFCYKCTCDDQVTQYEEGQCFRKLSCESYQRFETNNMWSLRLKDLRGGEERRQTSSSLYVVTGQRYHKNQ